MSKPDWSLEKELINLSGTSTLPEAMVALNLIASDEEMFRLSIAGDWSRSGSETYLFRFNVESPAENIRQYVLKACVAFSPAHRLEEILDEWISRRRLLSRMGISVPTLHGSGNGIVLEEAIPFTLSEKLANTTDSESRQILLHGLAEYAGVLEGLGFEPISPFSDLLSRGNDVVVVDFGSDLGTPRRVDRGAGRLFQDLISFLRKSNLSPIPGLQSTFKSAVIRGLEERTSNSQSKKSERD